MAESERKLQEKLEEVAPRKRTTPEGLVNVWVREKLEVVSAGEP